MRRVFAILSKEHGTSLNDLDSYLVHILTSLHLYIWMCSLWCVLLDVL